MRLVCLTLGFFLLVSLVVASLYWHFLLGPEHMLAAIQRGDVEAIDRLANWTIHPDSEIFLVGGMMHCAVACGQIQSMAKLRDLGADMDRLDGYGGTPLHVAVQHGQLEAFRWLLINGADPSVKDRNGHTVADAVRRAMPEPKRAPWLAELATQKSVR